MEFGGPGARRGVRGVVFVSFLRAVEFWRGEARKMVWIVDLDFG